MDAVVPEISTNVALTDMNTLRVSASAAYFCRLSSVDRVQPVLQFARARGLTVTALGGGSNLVLAGDIKGLVVVLDIKGIDVLASGDERLDVRFGAGECWHTTVEHCLDQGWYGLENLSLIPGNMGAAPIQNIGAYGVELSDLFVSLDAIEIATGQPRVFNREDCEFGYRDSVFKQRLQNQYLITAVTLRLSRQPQININYPALKDALGGLQASPQQISDAVCQIRQQKLPDPAITANVGSFFTNPIVSEEQALSLISLHPNMPWHVQPDGRYKIPAAWLIEKCGFKGQRYGNVSVHQHQALVLVNHGGTGLEVLVLADKIVQAVADEFGIDLVIEPRVYGRE